jgi:hypothetical protein
MTNESTTEPTTELYFAVELSSDGAIHVYREATEWKEGKHDPTIPEVADLASRIAKELDRHLIVEQMTDKFSELLEQIFPTPDPSFSQKLVEALQERGITPTKKDE